MISALNIIQVIICVLLVIVVLLQFGKGAEAGAMMGSGSSQNIFTSSTKGNFFSKFTTVLAILFMVNSVLLKSLNSRKSQNSVFDDEAPIARPLNSDAQAPTTQAAPAAEATTATTTNAATTQATAPAAASAPAPAKTATPVEKKVEVKAEAPKAPETTEAQKQ